MAQWDIADPLLNGISLAQRIAGQRADRALDSQRLEDQESTSVADSVARTGYTPDELGDPASGAGADIRKKMAAAAGAKSKLEGAQADYYSGRNAAYTAASQARAGAAASRLSSADLQKQIKDFDQMSMVDPDGSKGIYTPERAQQHAALLNQFALNNRIAGFPANNQGGNSKSTSPGLPSNPTSAVSDLAGGLAQRAAVGIQSYFGGGQAPDGTTPPSPSAGSPSPSAPPPPPPGAGGIVRVRNKATGQTGSIPQSSFNPSAYEPL